MDCDEATQLMLDQLAGRLDDRSHAVLDEHLRACANCREAAAAQAEVSTALAARPEADVSPSFAARLTDRLDEEAGWFGLADWRWLSVRLAPIAAILLLAAGIVIERQDAGSSPQPSLTTLVDTWTSGGGSGEVPVTSVLWQPQTNDDAAVLAVLAAPSDATIAGQTDER